MEYVYNAFYKAGPDLNYSFSGFPFGGGGGFRFPYATLMTETDERGEHRSYLATEENFRILSEMERNNAIVPITGDFGGPKALRSVGRYLKSHDATVTAIYTSNVEQYLFQSDTNWRKYYAQHRDAADRREDDVHPVGVEPRLPGRPRRLRSARADAALLRRRAAEGLQPRPDYRLLRRDRDVEMTHA